jgi:N utilization substance protein A
MKSDFLIAVTQLASERNLPKEIVIEAIEAGLVSAYKKDNTGMQEIAVRLDPGNGTVTVFNLKKAVAKVEDDELEISMSKAKKIKADVELGEIVQIEALSQDAGRIGAQTAKQVVMQRLKEAERELIFAEFEDKQGTVVSGTVTRVDARHVAMDLGRGEAVLYPQEQALYERYKVGQRLKVYVLEIRNTIKGPEILVSRAHKDLLVYLFQLEIPEVLNGIVEIKDIAREPGSRSKVAVEAKQEGVDPVGSCVGLRGIRIQNIVNELQGEKIDIIEWDEDPRKFISNALSPAQVLGVYLNKDDGTAEVVVNERHLSLAIGKEGQNVRLAARLSGWKVDIRSSTEVDIKALEAAAVTAQKIDEKTAPVVEPDAQQAAQLEEAIDVVTVDGELAVETNLETGVPDDKSTESSISVEEELAIQSVKEEQSKRKEVLVPEVSISSDVWELPIRGLSSPRTGTTELRFAEDILPDRGRSSSRSSRGRKKTKTKEETQATKAKQTSGTVTQSVVEDED